MRALAALPLLALLGACGSPSPEPAPLPMATRPMAVNTPPPTYPEALACNGVGGVVQLRVRIETDGHVRDAEIDRTSGNADLDDAARKGVQAWTFQPATQGGKPVAQWIVVPMTFHVPQPKPERCFAIEEQAADALKAK